MKPNIGLIQLLLLVLARVKFLVLKFLLSRLLLSFVLQPNLHITYWVGQNPRPAFLLAAHALSAAS